MNTLLELFSSISAKLHAPTHGGEVWEVADRLHLDPRNILDFSANVNPLGPPRQVERVIKTALRSIPLYPDREYTELKEAISQYIGGVRHYNVIAGNGATELIHLFAETFLREGDEALMPIPTFSEYEYAVRRVGAKPRFTDTRPGFHLDPGELTGKVTKRTKVIFLCNPNNPSSTTIRKPSLLQILDFAEQRNIALLIDETFIEFVNENTDSSVANEVEEHHNLFVLRSLTKAFALAGLRIGYGLGNRRMVKALDGFKPPWNVNCLAQAATIASLRDKQYLETTRQLIKRERRFLFKAFGGMRLKVVPPQANFLLANVSATGVKALELKARLLAHRILIRDCSSFRGLGHDYVRVAVRKREDNLALLAAIREALA